MDVIDRIVRRLVESDAPLERAALAEVAERFAAEEAPLLPGAAAAAVDELVGLGPLEPLLADPSISDVLVNGPEEVWVERAGELIRTDVCFRDQRAIVAAVERVISPLGLRLDRASPAVDARLPDGSRLHAAIPPVAVEGPVVAVRRFTAAVPDLAALQERGAITAAGARRLAAAVRGRLNLIVSGGTGAGKTTLLNLLSREIPAGERTVTVEDAAELRLAGHVVRLEARPPNTEGAGEVRLRALLRHALRLRPDRIIVGEVRGAEAFDLVQAMNTGHGGSMSTVHANGPEDAMLRLETLALSGAERVGEGTIRRQLRRAVDLVVHVERRGGMRRVAALAAVDATGIHEEPV